VEKMLTFTGSYLNLSKFGYVGLLTEEFAVIY
jgi:hypothetical protein